MPFNIKLPNLGGLLGGAVAAAGGAAAGGAAGYALGKRAGGKGGTVTGSVTHGGKRFLVTMMPGNRVKLYPLAAKRKGTGGGKRGGGYSSAQVARLVKAAGSK